MYAASEAEDFERAARLRDDLGALEQALEKQAVVLGDGTDADVIAFAEDPLEVAVQIFYVRGGRVRGQRGWVADRVDDGDTPELVERFLLQLYGGAGDDDDAIPREMLVPALPPDADVLEELLSDQRGSRVRIRVPQRGDKRTLQETVARNATQALALHKTKRASDLTTRNRALEEIQAGARAAEAPLRIECYDISNLQGTEVVGVDGGLRGRPGPQERVPPVRDPGCRRPERRRVHARGHHPPVPAAARRAAAADLASTGDRPTETGPMLVDPDTGRPASSPTPRAGRRRRWSAAGRGGTAGARRARHRRHPGVRPGQAARGGLAARRGGPGDPAAHQRGALPAPAAARRGPPLRDHPPPFAALQVDGGEPARRRARAWARCAARRCSSTSGRSSKLRAATVEEIAEVPGIGQGTAAAIKDASRADAAA